LNSINKVNFFGGLLNVNRFSFKNIENEIKFIENYNLSENSNILK
jgi:hypothetical protein